MEVRKSEVEEVKSSEVKKEEIKENVKQDIVTKNGISAYSIVRNGKVQMILNKNGKEIIINEGDAELSGNNFSNLKEFNDLIISNDGSYFAYTISFYEGDLIEIYDIKNEKKLDTEKLKLVFNQGFGFSNDGKYFYFCAGDGVYADKNGFIYSISSSDIKYDFMLDVVKTEFYKEKNFNDFNINCSYDKSRNSVFFRLDNSSCSGTEECYNNADKKMQIEYNLTSGKVNY